MVNIQQLLTHFIDTGQELCQSDFLAPCVRQRCLSTCINGVTHTLNLKGWPFEGWGLFRPVSFEAATLVKEAGLADVNQYLQRLPALQLYLVGRLQHRSWLAYPMNASDARQRLGIVQPMVVHLVTDGEVFDPVIARWDGHAFWFDRLDRQADMTSQLRQSMAQGIRSDRLCIKGLSAAGQTAYSLACQQADCSPGKRDNWSVHWTTTDGEDHTTTITKEDLTVSGTGICWSD
ncbi:MAG: hypothetical protein AAF579_06915 [Cyanobacteria bacterium P01_C01_bin.118]